MTTQRSPSIVDLGELQLEVLDQLTKLGEGTVYDILDQFDEARRPRYTTVLTVLRSLEKKGLVSHRTRQRTYIFRPTKEAAGIRKQVVRSVLNRVFGGSTRAMVAALLDAEDMSEEALAELTSLIREKQEGSS